MSRAVDDLYDKAFELSVEERAELAAKLLETLDAGEDSNVEEAWAAEIERRMTEYRAGRVRTIPWSEVRLRLHRR